MKIINRMQFLAMPAGVLFSKYQAFVFGDLQIKGESYLNDFLCQGIAGAIKSSSSEEFIQRLDAAQSAGISLEIDLDYYGRDGLFDADQLFAVWEPSDVVALIEQLQRCPGVHGS